jgi:Tol biopolymer transport system component
VLKSRQAKGQLQWSPDGRAIAYVSRNDIWMLPLFGDRKPIPVVQSGFGEDGFSFSPDGRWLAYRSNESGQPEIHVRPLPSDLSQTRPERGVRVSIGGASNPRWRRDAKELFYLDRDNVLTAVDVLEGQTFQTSQPRRLFETCANAYNLPPFYDVTADGQRFLIGCPAEEGTGQIQVWVNWAEAIER